MYGSIDVFSAALYTLTAYNWHFFMAKLLGRLDTDLSIFVVSIPADSDVCFMFRGVSLYWELSYAQIRA